jgi:hypothetical protein
MEYFFVGSTNLKSALTAITFTRYRIWAIPFAFLSMALFHLFLAFNKSISFYKLMGCGKNGTFDKVPDLRQWAILTVYNDALCETNHTFPKSLNRFIKFWLSVFGKETFTIYLNPILGHGTWDGKQAFGILNKEKLPEGRVATLTRATIRLNKLNYFWKNVAPVASQMAGAKGFVCSFGIGEIPWIKQATFSIWESETDMKNFAYQMKAHAEVIKMTRQQNWYSEDMFVRFSIIGSAGTLKGINPLVQMP